MYHLVVECLKCFEISIFNWCFNNYICISSLVCKKCCNSFQLIAPDYGNDSIIINENYLPLQAPLQYYDAYYYNESDGNFYYHQLAPNKTCVPIFYLNKTVVYCHYHNNFSADENGLVTFEDIEKFVNNYQQ